MKKISEDQKQKMIQEYSDGISPTQIGATYNIHPGSVSRKMRQWGIERQVDKPSQEMIKTIIEDYSKGISSEIIANNLNIDGSTVRRHLKKNNIEIRPATENKRKYDIDQLYFENIDTEEKAYLLGFLYADGNVSKRGYCISITQHPQDIDILEKFSNIIYGFIKISDQYIIGDDEIERLYKSFYIYSKIMHKHLIDHGCVPKKSLILKFPNHIRDDLMRHFVRGYFDGDGCISLGKPVLDITSSIYFLNGLNDYLVNKLNIVHKNLQDIKKCVVETKSLQIGAHDEIKLFLDHIYDNSSIFLNRKYNLYLDYLKLLQNKESKKISKYLDLSKYGTSFIPEFNKKLLISKNVKLLSMEEKNDAANFLFKFYRENGFPYTKLTNDEILNEFNCLKNSDQDKIYRDNKILLINNYTGIQTFKHFAPHYFETQSSQSKKLSMLDTFNNDDLLLKVIKNRLSRNHNITGNMLKQGLASSKLAFKASIFNPMVAKYIYTKYTKENDIIYDYSMGFGQRLLAAMSLPHKITYIGIDPLQKSVESNINIFNFLNTYIPAFDKKADIICGGSENYCDEKYIGKVNVAFSSPPYFDIEKYSEDQTQAYSDNSYINFINIWWKKVVNNIDKLLLDNGYFILNINNKVYNFNIKEDMCNTILEKGYRFIDQYNIQLTNNSKYNNSKGIIKYEPILIFKKQ